MIRTAFILLLLFHGFIHLIGFARAYGWAETGHLARHISRFYGALWLIAGLLIFGSVLSFILNSEWWWILAFAGVLLSQVLVIIFWREAKFGTIANIIILIVAVPAFGQWTFEEKVADEMREIFSRSAGDEQPVITKEMISHLPHPVKKWLTTSGVIGRKKISRVHLRQEGLMKTDPGQISWSEARAEQYFTIDRPAFIWKVDLRMKPLIRITGRDLFYKGEGHMLIKAFSLMNVVDADGEKVDRGSLQRYLGEIVWFPTAALSPYIRWQAIDSTSAQATMRYRGTSGSAVFHFNGEGDFVKYSAERYRSGDKDAQLRKWVITVTERKKMNGITIPVKLEATWKLDSGDFTWYKLEITEIEYF